MAYVNNSSIYIDKMRFEFSFMNKGTKSIGISGWNKKIYWHIYKFNYPGCKKFQIRVYNRQTNKVIFQIENFSNLLTKWIIKMQYRLTFWL